MKHKDWESVLTIAEQIDEVTSLLASVNENFYITETQIIDDAVRFSITSIYDEFLSRQDCMAYFKKFYQGKIPDSMLYYPKTLMLPLSVVK